MNLIQVKKVTANGILSLQNAEGTGAFWYLECETMLMNYVKTLNGHSSREGGDFSFGPPWAYWLSLDQRA